MKRAIFYAFMLTCATSAFGQGQVYLNNRISGILVTHVYGMNPGNVEILQAGNGPQDTPPGTTDWSAYTPISGPGYTAQLWAAPGPNQPFSALQPLFPTTTFRTGAAAGQVVPITLTLPGVQVGGGATVMLRVWDNQCGTVTDWNEARNTGRGITSGESPLFNVDNVGGGLIIPPFLTGLQSFNLGGCLGPYFYGITEQPTDQVAVQGGTAVFAVWATACPTPFYQWYHDGVPVEPNATCTGYHFFQITNIQPADAGSYWAVTSGYDVCCGYMSSTSAVATLTVLSQPNISSQPQSQTVFVGSTVDLSVSAEGTPPLSYQWYFNGNAIPDARDRHLLLPDLQLPQSGTYAVVVSNAVGSATSSPALLIVLASPPTILVSPVSQTKMTGAHVAFDVAAVGAIPLAYQWFFNGAPIPDATTHQLSYFDLQPSQSGSYTVVITNAYGSVTSAPALLTVLNRAIGEVIAWGLNGGGQTNVPDGLSNVIAVAAGGEHSLALTADGTIVGWGHDGFGQSQAPANLGKATAIAAGAYHSLALRADGTVAAWGDNLFGQTKHPAGLSNVVAIAAGMNHSLALTDDGAVAAWGQNDHGQTDVPADLTNVVAIAAGASHNLALQSNGLVVAWGLNDNGQTTVPAGLNHVIALAAGSMHSLVLESNGLVFGWGSNDQLSHAPRGLGEVTAIAAGFYHNLALKSDGTMVVWGDNQFGQTNEPAVMKPILAIVSGEYHSLALVSTAAVAQVFPSSQTVEAGSTARFRARAQTARAVSFAWFFDGMNALTPATSDGTLLLLTNVQPPHAGAYTVLVSNEIGTAVSPPALLSVIQPVPRRMVPGLILRGQPGNVLNVDFSESMNPSPAWQPLDQLSMTDTSQQYFDLSEPLPSQRFYRAWQAGALAPSLGIHMIPVISVTGTLGNSVRVDAINHLGPTNAWMTLGIVTLTNSPQLFFDTAAIGQPPRLYRLVPLP